MNLMKTVMALALGALIFAGAAFAADTDKPATDKASTDKAATETPEAVTAAFKKLAGDAKVTIEAKKHKKKTFYIGEWTSNDKDHEAVVDARGTVLKEEVEVDAESVPEAVRKAAAELLGKDATIEYDKITLHIGDTTKVVYDAESDDKEVTIDTDGKKIKGDDDDDDDEAGEEDDDDDDDEEDDDDDDEEDDDDDDD